LYLQPVGACQSCACQTCSHGLKVQERSILHQIKTQLHRWLNLMVAVETVEQFKKYRSNSHCATRSRNKNTFLPLLH